MNSVSATTTFTRLPEPVELRGRLNQCLGTIHRVVVSGESGRIILVELDTPWQTLQLSGDLIEPDQKSGLWHLKPARDTAASSGAPSRANPDLR
ncbi:MAG: hypothetical protein AAGI72_06870 [Pseudomonadota bacterium]